MNFTLHLKYPFIATMVLYDIINIVFAFPLLFLYWRIIIINITVLKYNIHAMALPDCVLNYLLLWNRSDRVVNNNIPTYIIILLICMPAALGNFYRHCANNTRLRVSTHPPRAPTRTLTDGTFDESMFAFSSSGPVQLPIISSRSWSRIELRIFRHSVYIPAIFTHGTRAPWNVWTVFEPLRLGFRLFHFTFLFTVTHRTRKIAYTPV